MGRAEQWRRWWEGLTELERAQRRAAARLYGARGGKTGGRSQDTHRVWIREGDKLVGREVQVRARRF